MSKSFALLVCIVWVDLLCERLTLAFKFIPEAAPYTVIDALIVPDLVSDVDVVFHQAAIRITRCTARSST